MSTIVCSPERIAGQRKIILFSSPGLRRNTLLAILRAMSRRGELFCFTTLAEGEAQLKTNEPVVVIIDYMLEDNQIKQAIPCIRQWNSGASILLIVGHPRDIFQDTLSRPDAVLCDSFSLASLVREVERLQL